MVKTLHSTQHSSAILIAIMEGENIIKWTALVQLEFHILSIILIV